jgi:hypothetical protein
MCVCCGNWEKKEAVNRPRSYSPGDNVTWAWMRPGNSALWFNPKKGFPTTMSETLKKLLEKYIITPGVDKILDYNLTASNLFILFSPPDNSPLPDAPPHSCP